MKLFKKTTVLLAMFLMLSSTSFADEAAFKATFDGQNITTTETELRGNIDNSNLQVEVIQQSGEQTSVIYTGRLGGYDNGNWNNIDFSDINFLVLFEWESADNEAIYIVPIQENTTDLANNSMSVMSVESESLNDTSPLCNTTLMYDNDYYEGALKINNTLNVAIDVENATKDIVCYIAEYSSTGVLWKLFLII